MSTKDGGPAFPAPRMEWEEGGYGQSSRWVPRYGELEGMTLRDYFAAKVMAALVAMPDNGHDTYDDDARHAYMAADAMLKAREA